MKPRDQVEANTWPSKLEARAVTPGPSPRLHGYDVQCDLARNYSFAETVLIALVAEAPSEVVGKAFEVALAFAMPCSVAQAPGHAAVLARICGVGFSTALATGAVGLTEQARAHTQGHQALWTWLTDPGNSTLPDPPQSLSAEQQQAVAALRAALPPTFKAPDAQLDQHGLDACVLAVLWSCGLRTLDQVQAAMVIARLPAVAAETLAAKPHEFRNYPIDVPPFRYQDPK